MWLARTERQGISDRGGPGVDKAATVRQDSNAAGAATPRYRPWGAPPGGHCTTLTCPAAAGPPLWPPAAARSGAHAARRHPPAGKRAQRVCSVRQGVEAAACCAAWRPAAPNQQAPQTSLLTPACSDLQCSSSVCTFLSASQKASDVAGGAAALLVALLARDRLLLLAARSSSTPVAGSRCGGCSPCPSERSASYSYTRGGGARADCGCGSQGCMRDPRFDSTGALLAALSLPDAFGRLEKGRPPSAGASKRTAPSQCEPFRPAHLPLLLFKVVLLEGDLLELL